MDQSTDYSGSGGTVWYSDSGTAAGGHCGAVPDANRGDYSSTG